MKRVGALPYGWMVSGTHTPLLSQEILDLLGSKGFYFFRGGEQCNRVSTNALRNLDGDDDLRGEDLFQNYRCKEDESGVGRCRTVFDDRRINAAAQRH